MRCLILGASGQVGGQIVNQCHAQAVRWTGTAHQHGRPGLLPLDIRDGDAVNRVVRQVSPDVIFLPAALTNLDYAQAHPAECFAINLDGAIHAAQAAKGVRAVLVFFSTDHVFPDRDRAHFEDDPVAPMSVYGQSKVAAEEAVRSYLPDAHLILRTSGVFGPDVQGKNFVVRLVKALRSGQEVRVPRDQYGQPTYGPDLARVALQLVAGGYTGTYHVVGPNRLSRIDFARLVALSFSLAPTLITGVPTRELLQAAPRPLGVRLATDKLFRDVGSDAIRRPTEALRLLRLAEAMPVRVAG